MDKISSDLEKLNIDNKIIENYKKKIKKEINLILNIKRKKYVYEPTMFGIETDEYIKSLEISHRVRQLQMKEGKISQILIGNFYGWEDLGNGHSSGLDCKKKDNSIIIEIKNKYNTCNSNSQKTLLDKLSDYKKKFPNTRCIWGVVNPKINCTKLKEKIIYNEVEIEKIQGIELFNLVFTLNNINYSKEIINFVKELIK